MMGVMVENGIVKVGTPICVPSKEVSALRKILSLFSIRSYIFNFQTSQQVKDFKSTILILRLLIVNPTFNVFFYVLCSQSIRWQIFNYSANFAPQKVPFNRHAFI